MCLSLGFSMRAFALIATDRSTFGPAGPDGRPTSSRELPGGKLRECVGGWWTIAGGSHCQRLLDTHDFRRDLRSEEAVRAWIAAVDQAGDPGPRDLDSYVTTAFFDDAAGEFHTRTFNERGGLEISSYDTPPGKGCMATIFPRGIEDVELQQRLRAAFADDIGRALRAPDPSIQGLAAAVMRLFDGTRQHTDFIGPTTDVVVLCHETPGGPPRWRRAQNRPSAEPALSIVGGRS